MLSAVPRIHDPVSVEIHDLRALLFWASLGISRSTGGSYADAGDRPGDYGIISDLAWRIGFSLPVAPVFKEKP